MGVKYKRRGKGIKYKRGRGIMDIIRPIIDVVKTIATNKDLAQQTGAVAKDVFNIGKNTKNIIDSIRHKKVEKIKEAVESGDLKEIIDRIHRLKTGSGFAYI